MGWRAADRIKHRLFVVNFSKRMALSKYVSHVFLCPAQMMLLLTAYGVRSFFDFYSLITIIITSESFPICMLDEAFIKGVYTCTTFGGADSWGAHRETRLVSWPHHLLIGSFNCSAAVFLVVTCVLFSVWLSNPILSSPELGLRRVTLSYPILRKWIWPLIWLHAINEKLTPHRLFCSIFSQNSLSHPLC